MVSPWLLDWGHVDWLVPFDKDRRPATSSRLDSCLGTDMQLSNTAPCSEVSVGSCGLREPSLKNCALMF